MTATQAKKDSVPRKTAEPNAVDMLVADHKKVKKLFSDYDKLIGKGGNKERGELALQICNELKVHTEVEETIFYPALRLDEKTDRLLDEAVVEHASAKALIEQILQMRPNDSFYDAKVTVLGEYINHHVKEEEEEMFPLAKKKLDLAELGDEMSKKKKLLLARIDKRPS
ncbi:hemerythrin [Chitinimonas sp. BJB300]|nr:hemerythrin [Chitinimonas sp. BJB300]TSJ88239.1 hemerythrin domain-containing protein [Chitinimonas sp. BJB300]